MTRDKKEFIEAILSWFNTPKVGNDEVLDRQFLADAYDNITQPHWISVDDELPPRWETNPNVSVPVITCKFVNRELQDIDLQRYVFGDSKWQYGDATHWMPFQFPKAPSSSEKPNNCEKGDEE